MTLRQFIWILLSSIAIVALLFGLLFISSMSKEDTTNPENFLIEQNKTNSGSNQTAPIPTLE